MAFADIPRHTQPGADALLTLSLIRLFDFSRHCRRRLDFCLWLPSPQLLLDFTRRERHADTLCIFAVGRNALLIATFDISHYSVLSPIQARRRAEASIEGLDDLMFKR